MSRVLLDRAIERQNRVWSQMTEIRDRATAEGRDLTAEERQTWDAAEADLSAASADVERFERMLALESVDRGDVVTATGTRDQGGTEETDRAYREAFGAYLRRGMDRLTPEQRTTLEAGYTDLRAQAVGVDTAGGYLVPEGFRNRLTETLRAYGGLLPHVEVITTDSGNDLPWPTNDDTANVGEILGENQPVPERDFTFGGRTLRAHIFSSRLVRVPFTLLQDSAFDLESWIPRKLGERIGRRAAQAWTTGTGVDQPQGITVGITTGRTGANGQTTSVIYDDLVELEHSVDPAYRPNARYVFHDQTLKALRLLTDAEDRPLWVPVPTAGFPATINGWPYVVDNSMPTMAAGANSIVFGDLRAGYVVRQVMGVQTLRLVERYAEYGQTGFLAFARMDGAIQDSAAIRAYTNAAS